jgi:hypothetical protein
MEGTAIDRRAPALPDGRPVDVENFVLPERKKILFFHAWHGVALVASRR